VPAVAADGRTRRAGGGDPRVRRAVAAAALVALALAGVLLPSGPSSVPLGAPAGAPAPRVVLLSIPGLEAADLSGSATPALDRYLGAVALLSVRAIGDETDVLEGYVTLGAGNRADSGAAGTVVSGRCIDPDVVAGWARRADRELTGAEPGALGAALDAAGLRTEVQGDPRGVAALMGPTGCVDRYTPEVGRLGAADVALVAFDDGLDRATSAAARAGALAAIDASVTALGIPAEAVVLVVAPAARGDAARVTVVGAGDAVAGAPAVGELVSPTTRRGGYVTLPDVAPTVVDLLAIEVPESMSGTVIARVDGGGSDLGGRIDDLADRAARVHLRDRAVGPVSVVLVVLIVLCALAGLAGRSRLARGLAPVVAAYPLVTFAMGAVAYHRLPLDLVVVAVPVTAAVVALAARAPAARLGPAGTVAVLIATLWAVLVVDVVTGGRLQLSTPLGYTPTTAGRFQGIGNLAFGLLGAAAVAVAGAPLARTASAAWAGWVGAATVVVVGAPAFGSDVGGTLALVPAAAVVALRLGGGRVGWVRLALAGAAAVALLGVAAALDLARDEASRTHLGRFAADLLDGDGWIVVRRKLRGNLEIFTGTIWPTVLVAVLVGLAVAAWRRRAAVRALAGRAALPPRQVVAVALGFCLLGAAGFALNDSGIAVPSVMLAVVVPWLVAVLVPPAPGRRERA